MELVQEREEDLFFWSSIKSERRTVVLPGAQEDLDERGALPNPCSRLIDKKNATYVLRKIQLCRVELTDISPSRTSVHPWAICLPHPLEQDGFAFYVDPDGHFVRIFLLTLSNDLNYVHILQLKSDQLTYQSTTSYKLGEITCVVATGPDTLVVIGDSRLWQLDVNRRTCEELLSQTPFLGRLLGKTPQGVFLQATYIQKHLAVVDRHGMLILWNCASNKQVGKVELECASVILAPSRVGPPLLAVASSAFLLVYDVPDLRLLKRVILPNTPIADLQWGRHTQILLQLLSDGNLPRVMRIDLEEEAQMMRPQYIATSATQGWDELDVEVAQFNSFLANKYDYAKEEEIATQWWVDRVCRRQRFPPTIIQQAVDNLESLVLPESAKRLKVNSHSLSGTVRTFLLRKGAALEKWDLGQQSFLSQPSTPGAKTSVIHAVCSGAKELLAECFRLQNAVDIHQTWAYSEQWDSFVGITPSTFSVLRRVTWWEQGASTLDVAKLTNVQAPLQLILEATDNPIWPVIVGSWFFTRSCIAPWLTVCYSLLEKSAVSLDALSSVSFDIHQDIDEYVQECLSRISDDTLDILFKRLFAADDNELCLRPTMNNQASLRDAFHSAQLLTALEAKVSFLLHVFAVLKHYRREHPRLIDEIRRLLPRMAVCSAGCALPYTGPLPDMRLGDHLARKSTTHAHLESIEFAQCLAQLEAWVLLDSWCDDRPGLRGYFHGMRYLSLKRVPEAVDSFHSVDDDCFQELPTHETLFTIEVPIDIQAKVAYYIHVSTLLESQLAYKEAFNLRKEAWRHWSSWATPENKEDESFQQLLWEKAFFLACNNQLWDEAVTAMFHLPSPNSRTAALRNLTTCLRIRGESSRILSWEFPEPLFQEYITFLQQQAYSFPPMLGSTSLHCYNVLYATFIAREEYGNAARVMYKMFISLQEYMRQTPIQHYSSRLSRVASTSEQIHTYVLTPTPEEFVQTEDPALLKVQRDALVLCTQALELMQTPRFVLGHVEKSVETAASTSTRDRLRTALQDAKIRANWLVVTPKTLKLCLLWTEARIMILELLSDNGSPTDAQNPAEVVRLLCSSGFVNLGLALAVSLEEDLWTCVVHPFLQLCLVADSNPNSVAAIADAARGNLLSFMFTRHDGSEPLGLGRTVAEDSDIATLMWRTLHEVAIRTNHVADVANLLSTVPLIKEHRPVDLARQHTWNDAIVA